MAGGVVLALLILGGAGWLVSRSRTSAAVAASPVASAAAVKEKQASYTEDLQPFIKRYCGECHSNGSQEGDFAFDRYASVAALKNDRQIWTKVIKLIKLGAMPPAESDQPSEEERGQAVGWLEHQLFYVDCSVDQNPGRVTVRRLNKAEYNNTVKDLLGVDFNPAKDFPSDDVGHGFDNIGDVLTIPPLLMEKYLAAAESIARAAIPSHGPKYAKTRVAAEQLKSEGSSVGNSSDGKSLASTSRVFQTFDIPRSGSYILRIDARQDAAGPEAAKMEVKVGGKLLQTVEVKNANTMQVYEFKLEAQPGKTEISAAFINDFYDKTLKKNNDRNLHVGYLELEGPLGMTDAERATYALIRQVPQQGVSVSQAALANLKDFLPRAFRRPVAQQELDRYVSLVEQTVKHGESFPDAMSMALQAVLISPHFLFRVEGGRRQAGDIETIDDFALASRLSYFLWSSMPDEELFQLAREDRLHQPDVLKQQTLRMMQDPRSNALIENFAGQWLGLRKLGTNEIDPDGKLFSEFTRDIRMDMWKETELFFGSVVRTDASIYELLSGQYTFLNERLAKFYGIDGVSGPEFRRVDLKDGKRAGVVTQGSVLTLTSYPTRTSPVKRGEWVLSNILGDSPPDPPPVVPALSETQAANPNLSFREQLVLHREDPGCYACHKIMDDIGFGLQNFDAVGRWRTKDGPHDIDASGVFPSGEKFDGPGELIGILRQHQDQFARCLTEKMLTFALGRGVEWFDKCAVDSITSELSRNDRFSTLVLGIVNSAPFQNRKMIENPLGQPAKVAARQP